MGHAVGLMALAVTVSRSARTARSARLSPSAGTWSAPSPTTVTLSAPAADGMRGIPLHGQLDLANLGPIAR